MEIRFYSFIRPDGSIYSSTKQLSPADKPIPHTPSQKNKPIQKGILSSDELEYLQNNKSVENKILMKLVKYIEDNI